MSELRCWFLRNVLDAAERQVGVAAVANLRAKLPPRLVQHAALDRLRASAASDCVPLDAGEEILLSIDSVLGDGSGKLLEAIGADLATRVLLQSSSDTRLGDVASMVARLHAFLEHPFVGAPFVFELRRNPTGFSLTVGVTGHSRATRALRHLTLGGIVAAERFAREVGAEDLKLTADSIADRVNISARYLPPEPEQEEQSPPSRRPLTVRAPSPSLSAEVDRILRSSVPPRPSSDETIPPESATQRVGDVVPQRGLK